MADNPISSRKVQLGFSLPLHPDNDGDDASATSHKIGHQSQHWSHWDGGKIGGRPSWLNPRDLPQGQLCCRGPCSKPSSLDDAEKKQSGTPLRFITQLYCPADDVTSNTSAFHRSLYVFACPTCCSASSELFQTKNAASNDNSEEEDTTNCLLSECIQVLRCQLPKRNDFFPTSGDDCKNDEWNKHTCRYWAQTNNTDQLNLCAVCGQRSKGKCPMQQRWFCSGDHQKEFLRASKKMPLESTDTTNANEDIKYLPSVYYESELVVEEEPSPEEEDTTATTANKQSKGALFSPEDITDADANLEQSDLNALTGNTSISEAATGVTDPTTLAFYARMAIGGKDNDVRDQCLRYSRWPEKEKYAGTDTAEDGGDDNEGEDNGPLWLSSENQPKATFPPPCQYCGSARSFEFQILPQMLYYLLQDPDNNNHNQTPDTPREVLTEAQRAVLLEAKSKIESGVELPEGFREQHEAAVANARDALLGIGGKGEIKKNGERAKEGLDWGVIVVYTCTSSCGDGGVLNDTNRINMSVEGERERERLVQLGAYREEVAWMQPPLDEVDGR
eukprot:g12976.t1 g12976   contig7:585544-587223(-)